MFVLISEASEASILLFKSVQFALEAFNLTQKRYTFYDILIGFSHVLMYSSSYSYSLFSFLVSYFLDCVGCFLDVVAFLMKTLYVSANK